MLEPLETAELLAFSRTVDARSVSRAAVELGVPRATISRRLARLEQRLGVRLIRRTTRSLALTDAGEAFYRHARIALDAVTQAENSVQRDERNVRGSLRVSLPPVREPRFFEMLCDFAKLYPDVRLQTFFSTQHVDLVRAGYDAAIRASSQLEPGLVARTIARTELVAVASPKYLAEHGVPRSAGDLRRHRCLMGFARGEVPETYWPLAHGGKLHVEGVFFSNELLLLRTAAEAGMGITLLPMLAVRDALDAGSLVRVLSGVVGANSRIALVYPEREFLPPQVRAFVDAFSAWVPQELARARVEKERAPALSGKPARSRAGASPAAAPTRRPRKG